MQRCETEIDILKEEVEQHIWTFRWLWLINLAAVVWGIVARHYDLVIVAAVSGLGALIGVGRTRRGRRMLDRAMAVCVPSRTRKAEPTEQ